ncbi:MAG: PEGA domain-containing protein [Archangium sp.]|nr:PEGA domain-containing protein [Archangium sp.]MDP3152018.1 PEGA domain-containing protein [Archangium sp.]MDP3575496.1 PEGA domain-containing protein [Archangium sp.]
MTAWLMTMLAAVGAPAVTVVVQGPGAAEAKSVLSAATLPVELRLTDAPSAPAVVNTPSHWPARLSAARKAYVSANFTECLRQLEGDTAPAELLATGERLLASRLLTWRTACHLASQQPEPARVAAEAMASFQLTQPEDVGSTTPDVEALLARAFSQVGEREVKRMTFSSVPEGAAVELDGRPGGCNTPCGMELLAGRHVVRLSADGFSPSWRVISSEEGAAAFSLEAAAPELAAMQWRRRTSQGEALDSEGSMRLLSTSLRAPRLLVVAAEPAAPKTLRGALTVDGVLKARAEREGDPEGLVRDLLVRGQVIEEAPPLYKRWPFWLAVGVAAVAAGTTTAILVSTKQTIVVVNVDP